MADSDNKVWLDKDGNVLVTPASHVYVCMTCPCSDDAPTCWQKYTAKCIYSSGATSGEWTTPEMVAYTCVAGQPTAFISGKWLVSSSGAYIWKDAGTCPAGATSHCSIPVGVEAPSVACAKCTNVGTTIDVYFPYEWYTVRMNTLVEYAMLFDDEGEYIGDSAVGTYIVPEWEKGSFVVGAGNYISIAGVSDRHAKYYIGNLNGKWDRPESRHTSQSAYVSEMTAAYVTSVPYVSCTGFFYPSPIQGLYLQYRSADRWWSAGTVWQAEELYDDANRLTGFTNIPVANADENMTSTYNLMCRLGPRVQFAYDQWGHVDYSVDINTPGDVDVHVVREARGAYCAKEDVPITDNVYATGQKLDGSPLWLYRTYIETKLPIDDINSRQLRYAMYGGTREDISRIVHILLSFCPVYYHIYIGQAWGGCDDNHAQGLPNGGAGVTGQRRGELQFYESVASSLDAAPSPYYDVDADWIHEDDEAVDQDGQPVDSPTFREFDRLIDAHRYRVIKLNIDNFPSWYKDRLCIDPVNPSNYDVPRQDFSQKGCDEHISGLAWPDTNIGANAFSMSSGYRQIYSSVATIDHAYCINSRSRAVICFADTSTEPLLSIVAGPVRCDVLVGDSYWRLPSDQWWSALRSWPGAPAQAMGVRSMDYYTSYRLTSGDHSWWETDTPRVSCTAAYASMVSYVNGGKVSVGAFGWDGLLGFPSYNLSGGNPVTVIGGTISNWTTGPDTVTNYKGRNIVRVTRLAVPSAVCLAYPPKACEPDGNAVANSRAYDMPRNALQLVYNGQLLTGLAEGAPSVTLAAPCYIDVKYTWCREVYLYTRSANIREGSYSEETPIDNNGTVYYSGTSRSVNILEREISGKATAQYSSRVTCNGYNGSIVLAPGGIGALCTIPFSVVESFYVRDIASTNYAVEENSRWQRVSEWSKWSEWIGDEDDGYWAYRSKITSVYNSGYSHYWSRCRSGISNEAYDGVTSTYNSTVYGVDLVWRTPDGVYYRMDTGSAASVNYAERYCLSFTAFTSYFTSIRSAYATSNKEGSDRDTKNTVVGNGSYHASDSFVRGHCSSWVFPAAATRALLSTAAGSELYSVLSRLAYVYTTPGQSGIVYESMYSHMDPGDPTTWESNYSSNGAYCHSTTYTHVDSCHSQWQKDYARMEISLVAKEVDK